MLNAQRFSFIETSHDGITQSAPYLPLTLTYHNHSVDTLGLLDTGASVNVLPYELGLQLGAVWEQQTTAVRLTGNLAQWEARGLLVLAKVGQFPTVDLAFAWTESDRVPLILGRLNFFRKFDVCFYCSQLAFEICPSSSSSSSSQV